MMEHEEIIKGYDPAIMRRILSYLKPYKLITVLALIALGISTVAELYTPIIMQQAIDKEVLVTYLAFTDTLESREVLEKHGIPPDAVLEAGGKLLISTDDARGLGAAQRPPLQEAGILDKRQWYVTDRSDDLEFRALLEEYAEIFLVSDNYVAVTHNDLDLLSAADRRVLRSGNLSRLYAMGGNYFLLLIAVLAFSFIQVYLMTYIGQRVMEDMRMSLFGHILRQSAVFFTRTPVGTLVTRITNDVETIQEFFTSVSTALLKDVSLMIGVLVVLTALDRQLALYTILSLPPVIAATAIYRYKARDAYRRVRLWVSRVNSFLSEHVSGMDVVQMFARESVSKMLFMKKSISLLKANLTEMYVIATFRPLVNFFTSVSIGTIIYFGAHLVLHTSLSLGVVIAYINLINMFYRPVMNIAEQFTVLQSAMAGGERIFDLLDTVERIPDTGSIPIPEDLEGKIEFRNVSFAYKEGEPVIRNLSFTINPGETVAIVGYTGAGKTTIANLLTRLWDIQEGEILLDGRDIRNFKLADLRRSIQSVQQDVFIFSGTVEENIKFGTELHDEKVQAAASLVQADRFISKLSEGYHSVLNEGGSNLSTGQRQLLSFSRVVVQDPRVIILDEATASIDTETEQLIQEGIRRLMKGRTSLVIAHRLSTIRDADRILVLSGGTLVESGTHDELLSQEGVYYNLYRLQFSS